MLSNTDFVNEKMHQYKSWLAGELDVEELEKVAMNYITMLVRIRNVVVLDEAESKSMNQILEILNTELGDIISKRTKFAIIMERIIVDVSTWSNVDKDTVQNT